MPRRTSPKASLPPPPPAARQGVPRVNEDVDIDMDDESRSTPVPSGTPPFARFFGGRDSQQPGSKPPAAAAPADNARTEDSGLAALLLTTESHKHDDAPTQDLSDVVAEVREATSSLPPPRKHRDSDSPASLGNEDRASAAPPPPPPQRPQPSAAPPPPPTAARPQTSGPPPPPTARPNTSAPPAPPGRPLTSAPPPPPPRASAAPVAASAAPPPPPGRPRTSAPPAPPAAAARFNQTQLGLAPSPFAIEVPPADASWSNSTDDEDAYPDEATDVGPALAPNDPMDGPPPPPPTASMRPGASNRASGEFPGIADVVSESEQHAAVRPPQSQQAAGLLPPVPSVVPPSPASGTPLPLPPNARLSTPPGASLPPPPGAPAVAGARALYGTESETDGYDEAVTSVIEPGQMEHAHIRHRTTSPPAPRSSRPAAALLSPDNTQRNRLIAGAGAVALVGALAFGLSSSSGKVLVAVSGPNGTAVDGVKVTLDEKLVCERSPCVIEDVEEGNHFIAVQAEGFPERAPQPVAVASGEETVLNVELSEPESAKSAGLEVAAAASGLSLTVDGKDMGALPQKLEDLSPGPHTIKLSGDRYEPYEQTLTLLPGQVLTLEPQKLKVTKGLLTLKAGKNSDGARVLLDGKRVTLPHAADLDTSRAHSVTATKDGYEAFSLDVSFDDGEAEQGVVIDLEPSEEGEASGEESEAPTGASKPSRAPSKSSKSAKSSKSSSKPAAKPATASKATGQGTLNLNSVPAALVILDGKPIGRTPKMGVKVSAGSHSVVFVSDKGRKRASTTVSAGATKTLTAKF